MKIRTIRNEWGKGLKFQIQDQFMYAESLNFIKIDDRFPASETGQMTTEEAQVLMDDLWDCGIRPTEGSGSAGSLAATERHLEDMRKITFVKLKITG